jgi:hypothetical protein
MRKRKQFSSPEAETKNAVKEAKKEDNKILCCESCGMDYNKIEQPVKILCVNHRYVKRVKGQTGLSPVCTKTLFCRTCIAKREFCAERYEGCFAGYFICPCCTEEPGACIGDLHGVKYYCHQHVQLQRTRSKMANSLLCGINLNTNSEERNEWRRLISRLENYPLTRFENKFFSGPGYEDSLVEQSRLAGLKAKALLDDYAIRQKGELIDYSAADECSGR